MAELLTLDGLDMRQEHMGVSTRTGRYGVPSKRGEGVVMQGRSGYVFTPNRPLEEGFGALSCWCLGAYTEDVGRKNLALNPSFEKASTSGGTVERYRNFAKDPRALTAANFTNIGGGSATIAAVVGASDGPAEVPGLSTYMRVTATAGGVAFGRGLTTDVLPSGRYNLSAYVRANFARSAGVTLFPQGTAARNLIGSSTSVSVADSWARISLVIDITTAGTVNFGALTTSSVVRGERFDITGFQITKGSLLLPYFDGTYDPLGADYVPSWTGTANASPSILTGPAGAAEVWRNFFVDPLVGQTVEGAYAPRWYGTGGAGTNVRIVDGGPLPGMSSWRKTWTTAPTTSADVGWDLRNSFTANDYIAVAPGEVLALSCWLKSSAAATTQWVVEFRNASNVMVGSTIFVGSPSALTTGWVRYTGLVSAAPATTVKAILTPRISRTTGNWAVGETIEIAGGCVTKSPVVLDFFGGPDLSIGSFGSALVNGIYFDDPDFRGAWTGTAHASPSVVIGVAPNLYSTAVAAKCIQSIRGVSSGTKSVRVITIGATKDSYIELYSGISGGGFLTGVTYTAMARSWQEGAIVNPTGGNSPRAMWAIATGSQGANVKSNAGPNSAGYTDHRLVVVFGANTYASIRLVNGGDVGGGDIWWDSLAVVEGEYNGPYFDGDSVNGADSPITWAGTPHDSVSSFSTFRLRIPSTTEGRRKALEDNLASAQRLFSRNHRLSTLRAYAASDGTIRRAKVEFDEFSEPNIQAGGTRAEFNVGYKIPDVFWEDEIARTQSATAGAALSKTLDLTQFAGMTGVIEDAVFVVSGPITNPKITDAETGAWIQYTGTIANGQSWEIDSGAFTSKVLGGASLMANTKHVGGPRLLTIPNLFGTSDVPRLILDGIAGGTLTNLTVTARRKWFS